MPLRERVPQRVRRLSLTHRLPPPLSPSAARAVGPSWYVKLCPGLWASQKVRGCDRGPCKGMEVGRRPRSGGTPPSLIEGEDSTGKWPCSPVRRPALRRACRHRRWSTGNPVVCASRWTAPAAPRLRVTVGCTCVTWARGMWGMRRRGRGRGTRSTIKPLHSRGFPLPSSPT